MQSSIGIAVITYRARDLLDACLEPLRQSPLDPRILVVNSSSNDGTVERARELGAETLVIPRDEFDHGATRERARQHLGTEIVVMLTPDAHATDASFLERLTAPLVSRRAAVAYARQLPRPDADPIERFNREFNYPQQSAIRSRDSYPAIGNAAHFCSNSACAWSQAALDGIGGFEPGLVSEETVACAKLLRRGHKLAYVADATVVHSHASSIIGDFRRQFDIGYGRNLHRELLLGYGADERLGLDYAKALLTAMLRRHPARLPEAVLNTLARYAGYRLGRLGPNLPPWLVSRISGQDFYWQRDQNASDLPAMRKAA